MIGHGWSLARVHEWRKCFQLQCVRSSPERSKASISGEWFTRARHAIILYLSARKVQCRRGMHAYGAFLPTFFFSITAAKLAASLVSFLPFCSFVVLLVGTELWSRRRRIETEMARGVGGWKVVCPRERTLITKWALIWIMESPLQSPGHERDSYFEPQFIDACMITGILNLGSIRSGGQSCACMANQSKAFSSIIHRSWVDYSLVFPTPNRSRCSDRLTLCLFYRILVMKTFVWKDCRNVRDRIALSHTYPIP